MPIAQARMGRQTARAHGEAATPLYRIGRELQEPLPASRTCVILFPMNAPDYFMPDRDPPAFHPLRDYLRRVPASVAEKYIDALTAPGDLVIDPFACTPTVARVAQSMGRRVIAVESNPLWAWLARTMATLPPAQDIDAALARLGDTIKDDAPLRVHISQLYATTCAACRKLTPVDYFLYARGAGPIQRHYTCVHCGETVFRREPLRAR